MSRFLTKYYRFFLLLILAWSFFTRVFNVHLPEKYVFDEVYHAITAKLIARNDVRAYEWWNPPVEENTAVDWLHPPLAKYTQAVGMLIFGENSFGWRISSVVFGVLVIAAVFKLADLAFKSKPLALTAALITSFDGLLLVQSRIAMNDIHVTFAILMTLIVYLCYVKRNRPVKWLLLTGISAGLAMGTKWSGLYVLATVGMLEAIHLGNWWWHSIRKNTFDVSQMVSRLALTFVFLVLVPFSLYIGSYTHMFVQGKGWSHFVELHKQIWWYQTHLQATHTYQSRPWQWFLDARPVWYYVEYVDVEHIANIYAFGNPAVFWFGGAAVIATVLLLVWQSFKRKKVPYSLVVILAAYFMVWLPWQLSPRIMFFYHYTPAIPLMAILIAYWLRIAWRQKMEGVVYFALAAMFAVFMIWYPQWTGLSVPIEFANAVYFAIPSWK